MRPRLASRSRGFTLVEILVVLVIVGILLTMAMALTRGISAAQKRSLTVTRMAAVDAALVQFVIQQRRLPCPANGLDLSGVATAGVERRSGGVCNPADQKDGVLPWATLGLTESDATDAWDRRLTFRIDPNLALDGAMDMTACDPAGTEPPTLPPALTAGRPCAAVCQTTVPFSPTSCTPPLAFLYGKGLKVTNRPIPPATEVTLMDPFTNPHRGAAYVVISAGESGGGAYLSTGQVGASSVGDGTYELKNYAGLPYAAVATAYVDDSIGDTTDANHFDDLVSRPSLLAVITKAGLGPKSH